LWWWLRGIGIGSKLFVGLVGEWGLFGERDLFFVLLHLLQIDRHLGWLQSGRLHENQVRLVEELSGKPEEGLLEVVVGFGGDVIVLEILLAMEGDLLDLDLAVLDVDLVAAEDDGDVFADTDEVAMPVGDVLVGHARSHIEHDNGALALDVISVAEASELLLAGGIPHIEDDLAVIGVEVQRVDLNSHRGDVFLLELAGEMALDEGGFAGASVSDEDEFEGGLLRLLLLGCGGGNRGHFFFGMVLWFGLVSTRLRGKCLALS